MNRYDDTDWWGSIKRGDFKVGWIIPPAMADTAPTVLNYYYDTAVDGMDNFIVDPSGNGFSFPEDYPSSELSTYALRLNNYMVATDSSNQ